MSVVPEEERCELTQGPQNPSNVYNTYLSTIYVSQGPFRRLLVGLGKGDGRGLQTLPREPEDMRCRGVLLRVRGPDRELRDGGQSTELHRQQTFSYLMQYLSSHRLLVKSGQEAITPIRRRDDTLWSSPLTFEIMSEGPRKCKKMSDVCDSTTLPNLMSSHL